MLEELLNYSVLYFQAIQNWYQVVAFVIVVVCGMLILKFDIHVSVPVLQQIFQFFSRSVRWLATFVLVTTLALGVSIYQGWIYDVLAWEHRNFTGKDRHNREVEFKISILHQELQWQFGSIEELVFYNTPRPLQPFINAIGGRMRQMEAVICVGTASMEGIERREETRAKRRAARLAEAVRTQLTQAEVDVYLLNLGQFKGNSRRASGTGKETKDQRRVIIIGVVTGANTANLQEALYDAITHAQPSLPFKLRQYSEFQLI